MDKLQAMHLFTRVVDTGSFTAAAEQLSISRALASKLMQNLEDSLGVRLLNRTTRRLSLTEPGQSFYQRVSDVLARLAEAEAEATELQIDPRGRLRVSAPIPFSNVHLAPALADFQRLHPRVEIELILNDRRVDLVEEGFDVAIRISQLADSTLIARKITPCRMAAVASPSYLAAHGEPGSPADLARHQCLRYTLTPNSEVWEFERAGTTIQVPAHARIAVNNGDFIASAAVASMGIARLPTFIVEDHLRSGRLRRVLPDWTLPSLGVYAVYPQTRALPAKTRRLIDYLVERFGPEPYWDRDLP
jgi:DNA-binding transcriptional LysR family regulator